MKVKKRLSALKRGGELKIFKNGKKSRYMGNLRDKVKIKEVRKRGPGGKKESLRERRRVSSLLHKIKQYVQIMLKH